MGVRPTVEWSRSPAWSWYWSRGWAVVLIVLLAAVLALGLLTVLLASHAAAQGNMNEGSVTTCGTGGGTQILATNGRRRSVLFVARHTNTDNVCVGTTSGLTCPGTGTVIMPGQNFSDSVPWVGTWFCRAENGTQAVDFKELSR